jgi:glycosyltransferase involved in cell wall biosynthesis
MTDDEVVSYLMATDVYVSTSLERSQIVSGTLSYAVACGRVAIATEYMYARELLAEGRGITVPFRDSRALASAINLVLGDRALRRSIEANAHRFGRRMTWPRVAAKYEEAFVASGSQTRPAGSRATRGIACAPTR